jgi:DNA-binding NarL/FixJ family response regulator
MVVLDCQLPGMSGPQVAVEIKGRGLPIKVLALSAYDEDRYLWGMWSVGALGYLLKNEAPGAIVAAVRTAAQGERLWTAEQLARVQRWWEEVEQRWKSLTEREWEVLLLIAAGQSNREIADKLCVTEKAVEKHVSNVLGKLMLASRTEVALWAVKTGLVSV